MTQRELTLLILPYFLAVCQLPAGSKPPDWIWQLPFWSVTRTAGELSLVLPQDGIPEEWLKGGGVKVESGWRALQVQGPLAFSLVGILAGISAALALEGISIFAVSTYDTDIILLRATDLERAIHALSENGYKLRDTESI